MDIIQAIVLGVIQGLTEFLPVSSSGHLELAKAWFGNNSVPEESMRFTVLVHAATALSTLVVYRKEVADIFRGLFAFKNNQELWFSIKIIVSMVPAAVVGVLFNDEIESLFSGQVMLVGAMLAVTGLLLFLADKAKETDRKVTVFNAAIIGIAQAIAILPGISRSGATISTSVLLGIDKTEAARFSFLMVVPLILGKIAKDIMDGAFVGGEADNTLALVAGFIAAFITGLVACTWMISLVKKSRLTYFSYYCFAVGIVSIALSL
jgi:undecaprenyl-diphosphatase